MQRYARGNYTGALKYVGIGARYADKLSQLSIGLMYLNGEGVPKDRMLAYAWTAVAAERGYPQFVATRDRIWASLAEAQQVQAKAAATKVAAEYGDHVAKPRMNRELAYWRTQTTGSHIDFDSGVQHLDKAMLSGGVPNANCTRWTGLPLPVVAAMSTPNGAGPESLLPGPGFQLAGHCHCRLTATVESPCGRGHQPVPGQRA